VGEKEEIGGVTYTVVDLQTLKNMIANGEDVTNVITSKIENMESLFNSNRDFNQDISSWDVGNVTNMQYMFLNATSFNQDISNWNTWKVTTMRSMFNSASAFNQDIGNWDVGRVRNFRAMFAGSNHPVIFNQDINSWNTISATRTDLMFYKSVFNKPIGDWRVNNVTTMQ
jgi:surface protein